MVSSTSLWLVCHGAALLGVATQTTATKPHNLRQLETETDQAQADRNLIVNGHQAAQNEYPWFVSLLPNDQNEKLGCGGTLIAPDRVLTAAHCVVQDRWVRDLGPPAYVRVGHTTHQDGQVIPVECYSIHPNYIANYNDLAIVKLATNVTNTSPVTLNTDISHPSELGQPLTAVGFGATSGVFAILGTIFSLGRIPKSRNLQKVTTTFLTEQECRRWYICANAQYHTCAMSIGTKRAGICYGDSGGPLLDQNNVQVGVVSFKTSSLWECADDYYPDVFMNVAQYYDWIVAEIASPTCTINTESNFKNPCKSNSTLLPHSWRPGGRKPVN